MASYKIKGPKHIDTFLSYISKNDIKNAENFLNAYPEVSNVICEDGFQPIFFCIRNQSEEIYKLLLEKMNFDEDIIYKIYNEILNKGTPYMLNYFIQHFNIDNNDDCLNERAKKMLDELNKIES